MVNVTSGSKVSQVKLVYEQPQDYLTRRRYSINIRAETVQSFVGTNRFSRILDIGCGDGSASLPLLTAENRLTLVDISSKMLAIACSRVPEGLKGNVEIVNDDFMAAGLEHESYDLILCIGVMAHAESPSSMLDKVSSLLRPGGTVVMESTDAGHMFNRAIVFYHRLRGAQKLGYDLNLISAREVIELCARRKLNLCDIYRYNLVMLPGVDRIIPQSILEKATRMIYGSAKRARNAWLGKECMYLFKDHKHKHLNGAVEAAAVKEPVFLKASYSHSR
jgi:2-polyprenyl-3-methyl-5-hydroxy-6-metoxy-1,4-benzoquinol methylase